MVGNLKIEQFTDHVLDLLYAGIAKLDYFTAIGADDVIVLFVAVRFFVLGQVFAELMFFHQIAVDQQFERVVHCGPTNPIAAVLHVDIQRFGIEMVVAFIYFFENSKSFRRFAQAAFFQLGRKNILDFFDNMVVVAVYGHLCWNVRIRKCANEPMC